MALHILSVHNNPRHILLKPLSVIVMGESDAADVEIVPVPGSTVAFSLREIRKFLARIPLDSFRPLCRVSCLVVLRMYVMICLFISFSILYSIVPLGVFPSAGCSLLLFHSCCILISHYQYLNIYIRKLAAS